MQQSDLLSEFNNIINIDNRLNFGLTVNSVGYKKFFPTRKLLQPRRGKISNFTLKKAEYPMSLSLFILLVVRELFILKIRLILKLQKAKF